MKKRKLPLSALEDLKESSFLQEQTHPKAKKTEQNTREYFSKNLLYPQKWHDLIVEERNRGKIAIDEASYIREAIRIKMIADGLL